MKLLLTGICALMMSCIAIGQEEGNEKKKLSVTEKMMLKMMFKPIKKPILSDPFDTYGEEYMIVELLASGYEDMGVVIFATIEIEDMDFSIKEGNDVDPDSYKYQKMSHLSGASIKTLEAQSKDKKLKMKEYIFNHDNATFVIIFKAKPQNFEKGLSVANQIVKQLERK